jgi:hypothetical protein
MILVVTGCGGHGERTCTWLMCCSEESSSTRPLSPHNPNPVTSKKYSKKKEKQYLVKVLEVRILERRVVVVVRAVAVAFLIAHPEPAPYGSH